MPAAKVIHTGKYGNMQVRKTLINMNWDQIKIKYGSGSDRIITSGINKKRQ